MRRGRGRLLAISAAAGGGPVEGNPLYVNSATGNDSRTKAQARSASTPWASIARAAWGSTSRGSPNAAEAAGAGDTVVIAPGTYATLATFTGTNSLQDIYYNPVNEGTSGAPIRFQSSGARDSVVLTNPSGNGVLIGAQDRDYIEWIGVKVDAATAPPLLTGNTGLCVFIGGTGGGLADSELVGDHTLDGTLTGDNWSGVRFNNTDGDALFVRNCKIHAFGSSDENHACLSQYSSADITVEQCELYDAGTGFYMKGQDIAAVRSGYYNLRRNYVHDCSLGIYVLLIPSTAAEPNRIYQNLFKNCDFAIKLRRHEGESYDAFHCKILNNTIVDSVNAALWVSSDWTVGTIASVTRSGTTVTVTTTGNHRVWTGAVVVISGADQAEYNGEFTVTEVNATSFTYTIAGSPATPATGTVVGYVKAGNRFQNNIVSGTGNVLYLDTNPESPNKFVADVFELQHNVYHGNTLAFADKPGADYTALSNWTSAIGQDLASPASITSDPSFVGGGDYHLSGASPCDDLGRAISGVGGADGTIIPCGMYITGSEIIGLTS